MEVGLGGRGNQGIPLGLWDPARRETISETGPEVSYRGDGAGGMLEQNHEVKL